MKSVITINGECNECGHSMCFDLEVIDRDLPLAHIEALDWICDDCFDKRCRDIAIDFKIREMKDMELGD